MEPMMTVQVTAVEAQVLLTAIGLYDGKLEQVAKRTAEVGADLSSIATLRGTVLTLRERVEGQYALDFGPALAAESSSLFDPSEGSPDDADPI